MNGLYAQAQLQQQAMNAIKSLNKTKVTQAKSQQPQQAVTYTQPSPSSQKTPLLPSTSTTTTKSSSKTALIIFLSILFAVIIIGAIGLYYHFKRTKKRMEEAKKVLT